MLYQYSGKSFTISPPLSTPEWRHDLLDVKHEPASFDQYGCQYTSIQHNMNTPPDADLLDIRIEDLCYKPNEDGLGFTFVDKKLTDDAGYDTSASLSPKSQHTDQDWIDSPASVESFLSSCSEFCEPVPVTKPLTISIPQRVNCLLPSPPAQLRECSQIVEQPPQLSPGSPMPEPTFPPMIYQSKPTNTR